MKMKGFYDIVTSRGAGYVVLFFYLLFASFVLFVNCKKETCYTCSTCDNSTGYIWDVEYLCGEGDMTNYITVFNDANNTAECTANL